jgi:hypothetical protein
MQDRRYKTRVNRFSYVHHARMPRIALAERTTDPISTNDRIDPAFARSARVVEVEFDDPRIVEFLEVFIPGYLDDPASFADRISLPMPDGSWRPLSFLAKEYKLGPIDPRQLVHKHARAGRNHKAQTIPGLPFAFDAIGIKLHPSTIVSFVNLDLDDGESKPSPAAYIALLRRIGACPLPIPGSGNPRRFRALLRLASPMPIEQMHFLMREVFRGLGVKCPEIYPHTTIASRVPGGNRACVRFYPDDLTSPRPLPFDEIVPAFHALPAFDLDDAYARFAPRPMLEQDDEHKTNPDEHEPSDEKPRKSKGKKRELTPRERADVERFRRDGIRPDERLYAYQVLVKDDRYRGRTREECCESMKEWIREGGIARSNHFRKRYKSRYIAAAISDIPRHVERLYAAYKKQTSPAVNLSARDILNLAPIAERVAAKRGITVKCAGEVVFRLLPRWKGLPDAIRTDLGILVHWTIFKQATGNKADYAAIRDEFGFFRPTSGYLPQHRAANGKGESTHYACDFPFDDESPGRALGRTWEQALKVAKARQDKPSCKARRTGAKTKQRCAKKPNESK